MVPREKMGPWKPLETQYYFKINESKVWINNQLSEIPNEDKVMILIKIKVLHN
jgi:hypothetical protein